jgi:hypothetical protein
VPLLYVSFTSEQVPFEESNQLIYKGQDFGLRFDRVHLSYELFQAGFHEADLQRVIRYLKRERSGKDEETSARSARVRVTDRPRGQPINH